MTRKKSRNGVHLLFAFFLLNSYFLWVAGRLLLVCGIVLGFLEIACGEGNYQSTRDGKTLVWNSQPKPGDVATWSGDRDRDDYARGFGRLTWYTREPDSSEPELYARYWGRMVDGKLEGPVNVHAKGKTHHAIFINGARVTRWAPGTASSRANAQWRTLVAKRSQNIREPKPEPAFVQDELRRGESAYAERVRRDESGSAGKLRRDEPEAPAAGPDDAKVEGERLKVEGPDSLADLYNERRPKIDIDDSLRLLAFPPRKLR